MIHSEVGVTNAQQKWYAVRLVHVAWQKLSSTDWTNVAKAIVHFDLPINYHSIPSKVWSTLGWDSGLKPTSAWLVASLGWMRSSRKPEESCVGWTSTLSSPFEEFSKKHMLQQVYESSAELACAFQCPILTIKAVGTCHANYLIPQNTL